MPLKSIGFILVRFTETVAYLADREAQVMHHRVALRGAGADAPPGRDAA
jgi:hypothetical protein